MQSVTSHPGLVPIENIEARRYICETCGKAFKRSEHRARHQRAHTQEKPFSCQYCRRRYARRDLVVRHERTLHADQQTSATRPSISRASTTTSTADAINDHDSIPRTEEHNIAPAIASSITGEIDNSVNQLLSPTTHDAGGTIVVNMNPPRSHRVDFAPSTTDSAPMMIDHIPLPPVPDMNALSYNHLISPGPMHSAYFSTDILDNVDFFNPFGSFTPFGDLDLQQTTSLDAHMLLESRAHSPIDPSPDSSRQGPIVSAGFNGSEHSIPTTLPTPPFTMNDQSKPASRPVTEQQDLITKNLPGILKTSHVHQHLPPFTDMHRARVALELEMQLECGSLTHKDLPKASVLQKLLQTFADCHLIHLPFLHLPSLDFDTISAPLVLAMCALGALYRLEADTSARLYLQAENLLAVELKRTSRKDLPQTSFKLYEKPSSDLPSPITHPIWVIQCRLLLTWYGAFTGNPAIAKASLTQVGFLLNDYRSRSNAVVCLDKGNDTAYSNWYQWIDREATKRLLLAIFILCNMLAATYGISPSVSVVRDGDVELPCDEVLWNADTEAKWQQCRATSPTTNKLDIRTGVARLMEGSDGSDSSTSQLAWSPFTAVVILHAVAVHFWHVSQYLHFLRLSNSMSTHNEKLQNLILEQSAVILSRCKAHIVDARDARDHLWGEAEGPLLFNSLSILRIIYLRAFAGDNPVNRMILLQTNMARIRKSLVDYISSPLARTSFTTKAAGQIFDGVMTPSRAGSMLIRKTAALSWSLEIAIAGWDGGLFLIKWLHTTEKLAKYGMTVESSDQQLLNDITISVAENDVIESDSPSLAANIGRHWAGYYDDTWSWGITPRFGLILRELASVCEQDLEIPYPSTTVTPSRLW